MVEGSDLRNDAPENSRDESMADLGSPAAGESFDRQGGATMRSDISAGFSRARRVVRLAVLAAVALYALSGIYVVQSDERGVVRRFGKVIRASVAPGIHYRIPWPVDVVNTPQVTSIKRMSVGYKIIDQLRGLTPEPRESQFVSGDENIIAEARQRPAPSADRLPPLLCGQNGKVPYMVGYAETSPASRPLSSHSRQTVRWPWNQLWK